MKKCPFCAEDIQDAAVVCKHCGRDLAPPMITPTRPSQSFSLLRVGLLLIGLFAVIPFTLLFGFYGFIAALFFILLAAIAK